MPPVMIGDLHTFSARQFTGLSQQQSISTTTTVRTIESTLGGGGCFGSGTCLAGPGRTVKSAFPGIIFSDTTTSSTSSQSANLFSAFVVRNPYTTRAAFKISQNESPWPQTRVFLGYDYLGGARGEGLVVPPSTAASTSSSTTEEQILIFGEVPGIRQKTTTINTLTSTSGALSQQRVNGHHELFGGEAAFLDGAFSLGLRIPLIQQSDDGGISRDGFGDISVIAKCAILRNERSGNVLSTGVMVTAPTGPDIITIRGNVNSTLVQPFVGGLWNSGNFFVHGFSSVVLPADTNDVTLFLNSLGAGYFFYRGPGTISSFAPVVEVHVTNPLDNRSADAVISVPDIVNVTGGIEVGVGPRGLFTLGVTSPISSDRPFDFGALAAFNLRF